MIDSCLHELIEIQLAILVDIQLLHHSFKIIVRILVVVHVVLEQLEEAAVA